MSDDTGVLSGEYFDEVIEPLLECDDCFHTELDSSQGRIDICPDHRDEFYEKFEKYVDTDRDPVDEDGRLTDN